MIRPEALAALSRWSEVIVAVVVALAALWIGTRGGWLLAAVGILLGAAALVLARMAWQRLRLTSGEAGPGVVEIDEGQIAWYGPGIGGYVSVQELSEIGLVTVQGIRVWRFLQKDGQLLLVPVGAKGVEGLFDALNALPGLEIGPMIAALEGGRDVPLLWRSDRAEILRFTRP